MDATSTVEDGLPSIVTTGRAARLGEAVRSTSRQRLDSIPVHRRAPRSSSLHDLVLPRQDDVMDLIQAENGKARRAAFLEVPVMANTAQY